jgi:hypothetical protein
MTIVGALGPVRRRRVARAEAARPRLAAARVGAVERRRLA